MKKELKEREIRSAIICAVIIVGAILCTYGIEVSGITRVEKQSVPIYDTKITEVKLVSGKTKSNSFKILNDSSIELSAEFKEQGEKLEYEVTITNNGNVTEYISLIEDKALVNKKELKDIYPLSAQYNGITEDEVIRAGESKTFKVILEYAEGETTFKNPKLTYRLVVGYETK